jgi:putative membrane protein
MQWWNAVSDNTVPWPMFLPMTLWPIVVIGGIVALVVLLLRGGRTETPSTWRRDASRQTPFEILSERFARGEIDRQEYEERKGLLSQP